MWRRENSDRYCYFRPPFRKLLCATAFCWGQMLVVLLNAILEGTWLISRQAFRFPAPVQASNISLISQLDVVTIATSTELKAECVRWGLSLQDQGTISEHNEMAVLKLFIGVTKKRPLVNGDYEGLWETLFLLDDTRGWSFRMALLFVQ